MLSKSEYLSRSVSLTRQVAGLPPFTCEIFSTGGADVLRLRDADEVCASQLATDEGVLDLGITDASVVEVVTTVLVVVAAVVVVVTVVVVIVVTAVMVAAGGAVEEPATEVRLGGLALSGDAPEPLEKPSGTACTTDVGTATFSPTSPPNAFLLAFSSVAESTNTTLERFPELATAILVQPRDPLPPPLLELEEFPSPALRDSRAAADDLFSGATAICFPVDASLGKVAMRMTATGLLEGDDAAAADILGAAIVERLAEVALSCGTGMTTESCCGRA